MNKYCVSSPPVKLFSYFPDWIMAADWSAPCIECGLPYYSHQLDQNSHLNLPERIHEKIYVNMAVIESWDVKTYLDQMYDPDFYNRFKITDPSHSQLSIDQ